MEQRTAMVVLTTKLIVIVSLQPSSDVGDKAVLTSRDQSDHQKYIIFRLFYILHNRKTWIQGVKATFIIVFIYNFTPESQSLAKTSRINYLPPEVVIF